MKKNISKITSIALASLLFTSAAHAAGGTTSDVVPTSVEIVRNDGFMVFGEFGNPAATPCTTDNAIWVPISHPQYEGLLSTAITAVAGQLKLKAYVHTCTAIGWHGGTWNTVEPSGVLYISR
ncbi:hypothetical protein [Parasphingorhabdus sp.]|uniref:hypothetical protein n=1 Tax=Parasphingorhabdus sp. TaxID=2709688 RepID=UPI0032647890